MAKNLAKISKNEAVVVSAHSAEQYRGRPASVARDVRNTKSH